MNKVLCVLANLGAREAIERAFADARFEPVVCTTLAEARRLAKAKAPAAVVLDSAVVGSDAAASLLQLSGSAPLIALSDRIEAADRLRWLEAGAADCVGNPCDAAHLVDRTSAVVRKSRGLPARPPLGAARFVLVIDDSGTYAYALHDELRRDGHDVAIAHTAQAALGLLAAQEPDLVILDIFLPDANGVELCARLRQRAVRPQALVLVLTGRDKSIVRERALEAGADDFVVKSRDLEGIRASARRLLAGTTAPEPSSRRLPRPSAPDLEDHASLLELVAAASGLSKLVARCTIERACRKAGADPSVMTPRDLEHALPEIERALRVFLPGDAVTERMASIAKVARSRASA